VSLSLSLLIISPVSLKDEVKSVLWSSGGFTDKTNTQRQEQYTKGKEGTEGRRSQFV
jgi:hypothetical protein